MGEKHVDKDKAPLKIMDTHRYTPLSTKMPCLAQKAVFERALKCEETEFEGFSVKATVPPGGEENVQPTLCPLVTVTCTCILLLTVLMDKGENVVFRQFVGVDPRLGVVNSDAFLPSPKQPVFVTCTETTEKQM